MKYAMIKTPNGYSFVTEHYGSWKKLNVIATASFDNEDDFLKWQAECMVNPPDLRTINVRNFAKHIGIYTVLAGILYYLLSLYLQTY